MRLRWGCPMNNFKNFIIPIVTIAVAVLVFEAPTLFGEHCSSKLGNDEAAGILPYTIDRSGDQAIFLLSKGIGNWSTFAQPTTKNTSLTETAAKCFTENTLFMFGDKDYILPKLQDISLVKHPCKESFLYVAPIDFQSSSDFQQKLQDLMQKYGKQWTISHGIQHEMFKWVEERELLLALGQAQDKILARIEEGKNPSYVLSDVTHHVAITTSTSKRRIKLDANFVEFLLTPRCQDILQNVVRSSEGKQMISQVIEKNHEINNRLQYAHNHSIYSNNQDNPHPRFKASRIYKPVQKTI